MRKLGLIVTLWLLIAPLARADQIEDAAMAAFSEPVAAAQTASPGAPVRVKAVIPTFLLVREGEALRQLVKVGLVSEATGEAELRFEGKDGESASTALNLVRGEQTVAARAPVLSAPGLLTLRLLQAGHELARVEYNWTPPRRLIVYLSPSSHFDWGYTKTQPEVRDMYDTIFDTSISFCRETWDWPADMRFHYTADASYPIMLYLERYPEKLAELRELTQAGLWEVNAKLGHLCSPTAGEEVLARELYYTARELEPKLGAAMPTAIHTDVPGITWGDVDLFAGTGVKYLLLHPNLSYRGAGVVTDSDFPHAYYWQSRSGARVLVWRSHYSYLECNFMVQSFIATARELPRRLNQVLDRGRYPFDFLHLTHSGHFGASDNTPPSRELFENLRAWDERFAYPRLIFSTPRTFFARLEAEGQGKLPVFSGDTPDWWAEGVLTAARETGLSRRLHPLLADLEFFASLAAMTKPDYAYPAADINQAVLGSWLFDEHTWGYFAPLAPTHRVIFGIKAGYLKSAFAAAADMDQTALSALAASVGKRGDWVIVNSLGWDRSGPVRLPSGASGLRDEESGAALPAQLDPQTKETVVLVPAIPAFGYRRFQAAAGAAVIGSPGQTESSSGKLTVENEFLRLTFDRAHGGLVSIHDRKRDLEALDQDAKFKLGQVISRHNGLMNEINLEVAAQPTSVRLTDQGPAFTRVAVVYFLPDAPLTSVRVTYTIYPGLPWLDLACSLTRYHNGPGDSKYLAFPFAAPGAEMQLEIPFARMRPGIDQLPSYAPFYAVSNYIEVRNPAFTVTWSPLEAEMVEVGDIRMKASFLNSGSRRVPLAEAPKRPHVYSELMNNWQNTNYSFFQSGSATWNYRISLAGSEAPIHLAARPAYELSRPLLARRADQDGGAGALPASAWVRLAPDSARLVTLKRAEDGQGFILRVIETSGRPVTCTISLPGREIAAAMFTDVVERDLENLTIAGGAVSFELPAFALRNLRLRLQP